MLEHLKSRGMNPDLYPFMGLGEDCADFPMYDFRGRMTGYQRYRPNGDKKLVNSREGRYYSHVSKGESVCVFGLESWNFGHFIFLTGGLFKAATLHRLGYTALHVSATSFRVLKPQLDLTGRYYMAVGDNDDEGRQFARRYGGFTSPVDVDEMEDADVHEMLAYETAHYFPQRRQHGLEDNFRYGSTN